MINYINAANLDIGKNCHIGQNVRINVRGTFKIGDCSYIGDNCSIECEEFIAGEYLFMANNVEVGRGGCKNPDAIVTIGDHVGIFENVLINPNSPVTIGNDVGIGAEVMIWTHGSWLDITQGFPADFGPVTIGNNVWLPARSVMLPNTSIGDNTVIGIGSVITKSIPSNCLAAGVPCKVIRENCYPKKLSADQQTKMIEDIISEWHDKLVPYKKIQSVTDIVYNSVEECIELRQHDHVTQFYVNTRSIKGYLNEVSEDLRDFLRRKGIKFYTGLPFKSI